jgi:hypothetical protein
MAQKFSNLQVSGFICTTKSKVNIFPSQNSCSVVQCSTETILDFFSFLTGCHSQAIIINIQIGKRWKNSESLCSAATATANLEPFFLYSILGVDSPGKNKVSVLVFNLERKCYGFGSALTFSLNPFKVLSGKLASDTVFLPVS